MIRQHMSQDLKEKRHGECHRYLGEEGQGNTKALRQVYVCCTQGPTRRSKINKAGNFGDAIRNVCGGYR